VTTSRFSSALSVVTTADDGYCKAGARVAVKELRWRNAHSRQD
jgi:hypothetical protein